MTEIELRTRYRIVFLYREERNGKCVETPLFFKLSGAVDGDAFKEYKQFALEVYDTIPKKCLIEEESGVCITTYIIKKIEKTEFIYKRRIYYIFTTRKDGTKIAYKVDAKTGKKKQVIYKKAMRNHQAQMNREKKQRTKHEAKEKKIIGKKESVKQFEMFSGCYSPDIIYKGR